MEDIAKILANYGFPIAITMFLLVRMEKTITELRVSIDELTEKNTVLTEKVNMLQEKLIALLEKRKK